MRNDSGSNGAIFICLVDGVSGGKLDIMWTPALSSALVSWASWGKLMWFRFS